jgi:phospholipid/cholesterol/gamma-HCH transport system substrate-binding protein
MNRNAVETVMGAVVLVVAAVFLFFAYTTSQVQALGGTEYTARFDRVDGIHDGSDVRISGIKVGSVVQQTLDPKTFFAVLRLAVDPKVKLPVDTVARITSSGLLGDKYLALEPGNEDDVIKPGGRIEHTQSPMNLENMIGQYIFGQTGKKPDAGGGQPPDGGTAPAPKP